jgi:hypothetical protein
MTSRLRVRSLEVDLWAADVASEELKQMMKTNVDSDYVVCQKLAYEKQTQKDLEVSLVVALQSLRNDQVTLQGLRWM